MTLGRRGTLGLVFLGVFLAHVASPVTTSSDSRWVVPVALSILNHGDLDLDEYRGRIQADAFYGVESVGGHLYNLFPLSVSLVSLPLVAAAELVGRQRLGTSLEAVFQADGSPATERSIASIFVALAAVVVFLIAERELRGRVAAVIMAAIFAFATSAWSTASRALWQHGPSMLVLAACLYVLLAGRERPSLLLLLGPLLALGWSLRPTNLIPCLLLAAVARRRYLDAFWRSAALSLLVVVPLLLCNLQLYGALVPRYFRPSRLAFGPSFVEALAGNLVSPSRGLLTFSPVLALALVGVGLKLRQRSFSDLDAALVAAITLHWIAISAFPHWWGGHSIGPRLFTDVVPFLVYFLLPVVAAIGQTRGVRRVALVSGFAGLVAISVVAHGRGALRWQVVEWNTRPVNVDSDPSRVWDWRDVQFLR